MTLEEFKNNIENHTVKSSSHIFMCEDDFVVMQYIKEISIQLNKGITYLTDLFEIIYRNPLLEYNDIYVLKVDELTDVPFNLESIPYVYIICKKTKLPCIKIPKLEEWQILDYIKTAFPDLDSDSATELLTFCKKDIHRVDMEINRLRLSDYKSTQDAYNAFKNTGVYSDIDSVQVFDLIKAIENKNKLTISKLCSKISYTELDGFGITSLLYNAFRKMLIIATTKSPTEENTGIPSNQIWAIGKVARTFTLNQLKNIVIFLSTIQERVANGDLPSELVRDYVIANVLKLENI